MPVVARGIDLNFVAVMDAVPGIAGLFGHADVEARIGPLLGHRLEDDANGGVLECLVLIEEQAHAAGSLENSVLNDEIAPADLLPAGGIFAVPKFLPTGRGQQGGRHQ